MAQNQQVPTCCNEENYYEQSFWGITELVFLWCFIEVTALKEKIAFFYSQKANLLSLSFSQHVLFMVLAHNSSNYCHNYTMHIAYSIMSRLLSVLVHHRPQAANPDSNLPPILWYNTYLIFIWNKDSFTECFWLFCCSIYVKM